MLTTIQSLISRVSDDPSVVAERAVVDVELISRARAGSLDGWTTAAVERLARAAGHDPASIWGAEAAPSAPALGFLRGSWPDFDNRDAERLRAALERGATLRAIAVDLLGLPLHFGPSDRVAVRSPAHKHGYRLAQRVRAALGNADEPIPHLGDVIALTLHIDVSVVAMDTARLRGAAVFSREGAAIIVNASDDSRPLMRRRTVAHELCHALFDRHDGSAGAVLDESFDERSENPPIERRAGAFAAELLVPTAGLRVLFPSLSTMTSVDRATSVVVKAAEHFGAPLELTANQLTNQGYIHKAIREAVIRELADSAQPRVDDILSDVRERRVLQALTQERISEGRARELLGVAIHEPLVA